MTMVRQASDMGAMGDGNGRTVSISPPRDSRILRGGMRSDTDGPEVAVQRAMIEYVSYAASAPCDFACMVACMPRALCGA